MVYYIIVWYCKGGQIKKTSIRMRCFQASMRMCPVGAYICHRGRRGWSGTSGVCLCPAFALDRRPRTSPMTHISANMAHPQCKGSTLQATIMWPLLRWICLGATFPRGATSPLRSPINTSSDPSTQRRGVTQPGLPFRVILRYHFHNPNSPR